MAAITVKIWLTGTYDLYPGLDKQVVYEKKEKIPADNLIMQLYDMTTDMCVCVCAFRF